MFSRWFQTTRKLDRHYRIKLFIILYHKLKKYTPNQVSCTFCCVLLRSTVPAQTGQIGDYTSDISYHSVWKQTEEGQKENFKFDQTWTFQGHVSQHRWHLGEEKSTELFQELICAKQKEKETDQQFLHCVIGLKQKIFLKSTISST